MTIVEHGEFCIEIIDSKPNCQALGVDRLSIGGLNQLQFGFVLSFVPQFN